MNKYRGMYLYSVLRGGGAGDRVVWRVNTGYVRYTVYDQIPNLQNCFTTANKNLEGEGASDRLTLVAKSLYK